MMRETVGRSFGRFIMTSEGGEEVDGCAIFVGQEFLISLFHAFENDPRGWVL